MLTLEWVRGRVASHRLRNISWHPYVHSEGTIFLSFFSTTESHKKHTVRFKMHYNAPTFINVLSVICYLKQYNVQVNQLIRL